MAKIAYSVQMDNENIARAKVNEAPISPKHAIEIASFIRNKNLDEVESYLQQVLLHKKAIPFKKFNRNVAHKRGLEKWDAGRYPEKATKVYLRLINSVRKNAEYSGLNLSNLQIIHVSANRGVKRRAMFARAMGRATPKIREMVNIEIIVAEME